MPNSSPAVKEKAEIKKAVKEQATKTADGLSFLDVLRILGGLVVLSTGLSYLTTSGTSMTWGYNPWWTRAREWQVLMVRVLTFPILSSLQNMDREALCVENAWLIWLV